MDERRDNFPRLADAYNGDGFPEHGPWTPLSEAVLRDALDALRESRGPIAAESGLCPSCAERKAEAEAKAARAAQLRAQGMLFGDIATELGYPSREAAQDAVHRAARAAADPVIARLKAQTLAAKEIEAAWHDPHWPGGS